MYSPFKPAQVRAALLVLVAACAGVVAWAGALDLGLAKGPRAEQALLAGAYTLLTLFCVALAILVGSVAWAMLGRAGDGSEPGSFFSDFSGGVDLPSLRPALPPHARTPDEAAPPPPPPLLTPASAPTRRRVVVLASTANLFSAGGGADAVPAAPALLPIAAGSSRLRLRDIAAVMEGDGGLEWFVRQPGDPSSGGGQAEREAVAATLRPLTARRVGGEAAKPRAQPEAA